MRLPFSPSHFADIAQLNIYKPSKTGRDHSYLLSLSHVLAASARAAITATSYYPILEAQFAGVSRLSILKAHLKLPHICSVTTNHPGLFK
jgi:hypothetical protein